MLDVQIYNLLRKMTGGRNNGTFDSQEITVLPRMVDFAGAGSGAALIQADDLASIGEYLLVLKKTSSKGRMLRIVINLGQASNDVSMANTGEAYTLTINRTEASGTGAQASDIKSAITGSAAWTTLQTIADWGTQSDTSNLIKYNRDKTLWANVLFLDVSAACVLLSMVPGTESSYDKAFRFFTAFELDGTLYELSGGEFQVPPVVPANNAMLQTVHLNVASTTSLKVYGAQAYYAWQFARSDYNGNLVGAPDIRCNYVLL